MAVRIMTAGDITGEAGEKEAYSFFGRARFESDIGRGNLFITRGPALIGNGSDGQQDRSRKRKHRSPADQDEVTIRGFYQLSLSDQGILIEQRFPKVLLNLRKVRTCHACNLVFTFENELGRRRCVWHPGVLRPGNVWSCCGDPYEPRLIARRRRNGCSKCDHNDAAHNQRNIAIIIIPGVVAHYIGVPMEAIRPDQYKVMPGMTDMMDIELATSERLTSPVGRHPFQTEIYDRPLTMRHQLAEAGYAVLH
jgi:hypothetical protein